MKVKSPRPSLLLAGKKTHPLIAFVFEINQLKLLYRQGWLGEGRGVPKSCCESVAEHCFSMAVLAIFVFEVFKPKADMLKVLQMILIHEFGEIIHGDPHASTRKKDRSEKYKLEREAIIYVLREFPGGDKYLRLWEEFEKGKSPESRLVKQLDKLEMAFQSKVYALQHGLNLQEFIESVRPHLKSRRLQGLLAEIDKLS